MKTFVTKVQHQNTKKLTVILIFPRSCTYLLVCCVIYLKVWWHSERCTDNWLVHWNDPWFRTVCPVRWNNIKRKVSHVYYYLWHTPNNNFCSIEIAHSHVTMVMTKTQCWPQTKEVTIITVLIKNWPISNKTFNEV